MIMMGRGAFVPASLHSRQNSFCAERSALLEMRARLQCAEPNAGGQRNRLRKVLQPLT